MATDDTESTSTPRKRPTARSTPATDDIEPTSRRTRAADETEPTTPATDDTESTAPTTSESHQLVPTNGALVIEVDRKRRKKRYSRGLRDLQTTNRGMARASRRLVRAVERGIGTYLKESNRSARKKRDGAVRYFGLNSADAFGRSLREMSDIPADLARTFDTRGWRRMTRRSLKASARLNRQMFRAR
jgi:hypothetical protein